MMVARVDRLHETESMVNAYAPWFSRNPHPPPPHMLVLPRHPDSHVHGGDGP